jgi:hypothetical protein
MSSLRPECKTSEKPAMADDTALFLIHKSVAKRRSLIHGKLHDGEGRSCAIGSFWDDHPGVSLNSKLIDEVASVNDAVPKTASAHERWKQVNSWLRWKIKVLAGDKNARR